MRADLTSLTKVLFLIGVDLPLLVGCGIPKCLTLGLFNIKFNTSNPIHASRILTHIFRLLIPMNYLLGFIGTV